MLGDQLTGEIRKALIISISEYRANLQPLYFCKKDGEQMSELLESLGYQIPDHHNQIGYVKYEPMRDAIIDFFTDPNNKAEDTLLFYYSGHGIPDVDGDIYLASSEIDPDIPFRRGFSFNQLTDIISRSISTRIVTILDCCYSGAAKVSKGYQDAEAKLGTAAIYDKSRIFDQGEGKCILAASQAAQEAYALAEGDHSIFTYYLLEGLKGNQKSVDEDGYVTPDSLGKYVYRAIVSLPPDKRPKQTPLRKVEAGGDIILAYYPELSKAAEVASPVLSSTTKKDPSSTIEVVGKEVPIEEKKNLRWNNPIILILATVVTAIALIVIIGGIIHPFSSISPQNNPSGNGSLSSLRPSNVIVNKPTVSQCCSFIKKWGSSGTGNGQFNAPNSVVVDPNTGNVYVADTYNNRTQKFSNNGTFITKWGWWGPNISVPVNHLAVDPKTSNVYINSEYQSDTVQKFTGDGKFIAQWQPNARPAGIAVDSNTGNVYLISGVTLNETEEKSYIDSRITRANDKFTSQMHIVGNGTSPYTSLMQKFSTNGTFITKVPLHVYNEFMHTDSAAGIAGTICLSSDAAGIAVDSRTGNVYIVNTGCNIVQKFTGDGIFIKQWGGNFSSPEGVAVDPRTGNVYVADTYNHRIKKFTGDGIFIAQWGSSGAGDGQFDTPTGVAVDPRTGNVYVADTGNNRIQVFAPTIDDVPPSINIPQSPMVIKPNNESGASVTYIASAKDDVNGVIPVTCTPPSGSIFALGDTTVKCTAADSTGNVASASFKIIVRESFITKWGSIGTSNGQFNTTMGVAVDPNTGNVYVDDWGNDRIQKFSGNGTFITSWGLSGTGNGQFNGPNGVTVDPNTGNVYVADTGNSRIQKFNSNGTFITKWGQRGTADGQFTDSAFHLAVDPNTGNVYVSDSNTSSIQKFNSNGTFITKWSSKGSRDGQFNQTEGVAVDPNTGNVYVVDANNSRIQKFTADGKFIKQWGSSGTGDGQFNGPTFVAVDPKTGNVYVADTYNNRIQVFSQQ